jgi:hypothetical protein
VNNQNRTRKRIGRNSNQNRVLLVGNMETTSNDLMTDQEPKISSTLVKKQLSSVASHDQEVRSLQGLRGSQHQ